MNMNFLLDSVRKLREDRESEILVSGASGFLGSHLAAALHRQGHSLRLLCRGKKGESALERMRKILEWHEIEIDDRIEIVEGDICAPQFGLDEDEYLRLASGVTEIIHCASSTNFEEEKRVEIEHVNLTGTMVCLDFARDSGCHFFHYISTAYVAGKGPIDCADEIVPQDRFHNPYESSKHMAEKMVRAACSASGIGYSIYRPSIIVGNASTGRTLLFNAMYYPVKVLDYLQSLYRKDFETTGGRSAHRMSVELEPSSGLLRMPLRFDKGDEDGGVLNLVPIEYVVDTFMAIFNSPPSCRVYHIVHDRPASVELIMNFIERYYNFEGIRVLSSSHFDGAPKTSLERRFDSFVRIYLPYMADKRIFETATTRGIQASFGIECPEIDYEIFCRLIDYAMQCDWSTPIERMQLKGA